MQVGQQAHIPRRFRRAEKSLQRLVDPPTRRVTEQRNPIGRQRWYLVRQSAVAPVDGEQAVRDVLALLHVGFVEGVDVDEGTRQRRGHLPAEELGAETVRT